MSHVVGQTSKTTQDINIPNNTCTASPFSRTVINFIPIIILFILNKMMKQRSWLIIIVRGIGKHTGRVDRS